MCELEAITRCKSMNSMAMGIPGIDQLSGSVPPKSQEIPGAPDVRSFSHGFFQIISHYPLVNVYITMENHHVSWENPL